ncbi:MAG: type II toxin-antitoxin system mRNA interferase toxin, RelE/StbE family [Bacteriovoracaceae bacterium]
MTYNQKKAKVFINKKTIKALEKLPSFIIDSLKYWVRIVEIQGIYKTRKIPGYHDEPLKGERSGQRSIRLNRSYRAIYKITENKEIELIEVIEVSKHEY